MDIQYDPEFDMLYIGLIRHPSTESEEVAPGIVFDFDENARVVGIEIEGGSTVADLTKLDVSGLPLADLLFAGIVAKSLDGE